MQIQNILYDLFQTSRNGKAATIGAAPEEQIKLGDPILVAGGKISLAHGQFVEVAKHGKIEFVIDHHNNHLICIDVTIILYFHQISKHFY